MLDKMRRLLCSFEKKGETVEPAARERQRLEKGERDCAEGESKIGWSELLTRSPVQEGLSDAPYRGSAIEARMLIGRG